MYPEDAGEMTPITATISPRRHESTSCYNYTYGVKEHNRTSPRGRVFGGYVIRKN
jgi:hypothetical protein